MLWIGENDGFGEHNRKVVITKRIIDKRNVGEWVEYGSQWSDRRVT